MFVRPKQKQGSAKKLGKSSIKVKHSSKEDEQERHHHVRLHSAPSLAYTPSSELAPPIPPRPPEDPYRTTEHSITRGRELYHERQPTTNFSSSLSPPLQPVASLDTLKALDCPWQSSNHSMRENRYLERLISSKLDAVLTSIDGEAFSGDEREMYIYPEPPSLRGGGGSAIRGVARAADKGFSSAIVSINYFAKANLYANSRLPPYLPPLKLYLPSYPLICLAAQYSQRAYLKASGKELDSYVAADWKLGTKAMVIKSVPIDDMNVVVFAIRGSQTFMDWAVNLKSAPSSPEGFLDDPGNLCHSGFLSVARKMIQPVAARLRSLLEENPSRSGFSLLITGHSAGGAIASLLYAHMLAEVSSELNTLTGCFKRVHCLTFGTPPISLLPLSKPTSDRYKKSLFLSFINEGDPVPRADRAYIRSLLDLYISPAPPSHFPKPPAASCKLTKPLIPFSRPKPPRSNSEPATSTHLPHPPQHQKWIWRVPPCTLSNAGCLIALRAVANDSAENQGLAAVTVEDDVRAEMTCDQELRSVVFGSPVMHMMKVYARRAEILATKAVTARIWE